MDNSFENPVIFWESFAQLSCSYHELSWVVNRDENFAPVLWNFLQIHFRFLNLFGFKCNFPSNNIVTVCRNLLLCKYQWWINKIMTPNWFWTEGCMLLLSFNQSWLEVVKKINQIRRFSISSWKIIKKKKTAI